MDLSEAISGRRAVRAYTDQAVDDRTIDYLINAAVQAPSAVNRQAWLFTVVRNQSVLDKISDAAKPYMMAVSARTSFADRFRPVLSDPDFQLFYHAPVLILISGTTQDDWIVEDCTLAAGNLMLAAYAAGLGTCWIGLAQNFLNTAEGKNLLGLPADCMPVAPIIVGHPKAAPAAVPRNPPAVRWVG